MEAKSRFVISRTMLLHAATICAFVFWAARDLFDWAFCLIGLAVFYGCYMAVRISALAAQAELADDPPDRDDCVFG
jgi:hypothetical protein